MQTAPRQRRESAVSCTKRRCATAPNHRRPMNCGLPGGRRARKRRRRAKRVGVAARRQAALP
eukprot:10134391-Alexandrium_andersonii.AAC.1